MRLTAGFDTMEMAAIELFAIKLTAIEGLAMWREGW
jgi:hypothetical protein